MTEKFDYKFKDTYLPKIFGSFTKMIIKRSQHAGAYSFGFFILPLFCLQFCKSSHLGLESFMLLLVHVCKCQ